MGLPRIDTIASYFSLICPLQKIAVFTLTLLTLHQVNEANALVRVAANKHQLGEAVRITHLVVPQAKKTHEVLMIKAFWTYGCEIGINEHGLAMGEEAVYTTEMGTEQKDGIIGPDLMRLALERTRNCQEAIGLMTRLLGEYGQGGNCELSGNAHFDSSFILADTSEAYILETAGRQWASKKIEGIGSISNMLSLHEDWDKTSSVPDGGQLDWAATYGLADVPPTLGAPDRQMVTYSALESAKGRIGLKTIFQIMRHHGDGYHPAAAQAHRNICVHAGPQENRGWQADGVMVTEAGPDGVIAWVTGTSGTCVSIFKPVFLGVELPEVGPAPTERYNPDTLWWKHELLHRRAVADFDSLVPEIRSDFDKIEEQFLSEAPVVQKGTRAEKREFMDHCFSRAESATEEWIEILTARGDLRFEDPAYRAMWRTTNAAAGLTGMPA